MKMKESKLGRERGRPQKLDRTKAIHCAMHLFWENGYDAVGISDLVHAIGVTPPSLYSAFGSKHGIFEAAVNQYERSQGGFIEDAIQAASDSTDLIRRILQGAAYSYTQEGTPGGCMVLESAKNSSNKDAVNTVAARQQMALAFLEQSLTKYGKDDAHWKAFYTLTAMRGLSSAAQMGAAQQDLLETAQRFAQTTRSV